MQKYGVSVTSDGQRETIEVCLKFKLLIKNSNLFITELEHYYIG